MIYSAKINTFDFFPNFFFKIFKFSTGKINTILIENHAPMTCKRVKKKKK